MKKITIIFMSVLMIFSSCSMDIPYEDINENTETVEEPKEDDTENNTEEPSNEESKEEDDIENEESKEEPSKEEDNSENDNDGEGNSENAETVEESKEDNTKNNTDEPSNEEDDTENDNDEEGNSENTEIVEDESSNEDGSENEVVEDKTWCEISEDTKILGLNYFVCIDNSQTKLSPSINDESQAKKDTFLIRDYADCALKYIEIRVKYDNGKLNFSRVNDTYTIVDVTMEDSNVNITIEWE